MLQRIERWHALAGAVAAALAIAVGLVVVNACGLTGDVDQNVTPPKIQPASSFSASSTAAESSTPAFTVPPSPTWQIAPETTARPQIPLTEEEATTTERTTRPTPPRRTPTTSRQLGTVSGPATPDDR